MNNFLQQLLKLFSSLLGGGGSSSTTPTDSGNAPVFDSGPTIPLQPKQQAIPFDNLSLIGRPIPDAPPLLLVARPDDVPSGEVQPTQAPDFQPIPFDQV